MNDQYADDFFTRLLINPFQDHRILRIENNLINAINACPGIVRIGNTIVKTRNKKPLQPYINKQKIRLLIENKFKN